jgi:hypothetical protein
VAISRKKSITEARGGVGEEGGEGQQKKKFKRTIVDSDDDSS